MKKRAYERIPLDMKVSFLPFRTMYSGAVKNISLNGMYIEADKPLPFRSIIYMYLPLLFKLRVFIKLNDKEFGVPVCVKRLVKNGNSFIGMGVMLLRPSPSYEDFLNSLI